MSVSLDNFLPKSRPVQLVDSPRSLKACEMEGIKPSDLVIKSFEEFKEQTGDSIDESLLDKHYESYVTRVKDMIRFTKESRQKIVDSKKKQARQADPSPVRQQSQSRMSVGSIGGLSAGGFSTTNKEQLALENAERRQQRELLQHLDYEKRMAAKAHRDEQRMQAEADRERIRREKIEEDRRFKEEQKKRQMDRAKLQADDYEVQRARRQAEEYRKEQERLNNVRLQNLERERQKQIKADELARRHENFKRTTENILNTQNQKIEDKKIRLHAREQQKQSFIDQERANKALEVKQKALEKTRELQMAQKNEQQMFKTQQDKAWNRTDTTFKRLASHDDMRSRINADKRLEHVDAQRHRENTYNRMENLIQSRKDQLLEKRMKTDMKTQDKLNERMETWSGMRQSGEMRQRDIEHTINRARERAEQKRQEQMAKIEAKNQRLAALAEEKARINSERMSMRNSVELKKKQLLGQLERSKFSYTSNTNFNGSAGVFTTQMNSTAY